MKNYNGYSFMIVFCFLTFTLNAQVPKLFNYQGIARDQQGNPKGRQTLNLKISILEAADAPLADYVELHKVTTNEFGLYQIQIGAGQVLHGTMNSIPWEAGSRYIRVAIDPDGSQTFYDAGTTQLLSVPYAIYADKAGTLRQTTGATRASNNFIEKTNASGVTNSSSQLYDNGTSIGLGTAAPQSTASLHIRRSTAGQYLYLENAVSTSSGSFRLYNDNPANFATFTKYGSAVTGGYTGISDKYPYANILGYGNNGPFLNAGTGNIGFAITKAGTNKLKIHIDATAERIGFGGNAVPQSQIHFNNTDATNDTVKFTNQATGHLAGDGTEIRMNGNTTRLINRENGALILGTNNTDRLSIGGSGNVGIGTNSPSALLEVNGQVKINGGYPGNGKVLCSDASGLATWQPAGADSQWARNGSHVYNVNPGNIGLGTNSPTSHVHMASPNAEIRVHNTALNASLYITAPGPSATGGIGTAENYELPFFTNNVEHMVIKNNGQVGLGTNTPLAGYKMEIFGADLRVNGIRVGKGPQDITSNTAVGDSVLFSINNLGATFNTAFGFRALKNLNGGQHNTAIGSNTLALNGSGIENTAVGADAMSFMSGGNYNTAVGYLSLVDNTGNYNTAVGIRALRSNVSGVNNTAIGANAMMSNTGDENIALGKDAMQNGNYILNSIAIGNGAMGNCQSTQLATVGYNVVIGHGALSTVIAGGSLNTAIGHGAMTNNGDGAENVAVGQSALNSNNGGTKNVAIGMGSMYNNQAGDENTATGQNALYTNSGNGNVANGFWTLHNNEAGNYNTAIGNHAHTLGSLGNTIHNATGLGYDADPPASNTVYVGNASITSIKGAVGFTTYSDARFKQNVREGEVKGLEFISRLRPVTYNNDPRAMDRWKESQFGENAASTWPEKYAIESIRMSGFIAQEVEQAAREAGYDFSGLDKPKNERDIYGLRYAEFVVPLVKSVQELSALNQQQTQTIDLLKKQLEYLEAQQALMLQKLNALPTK